jgi:hypothetical protein
MAESTPEPVVDTPSVELTPEPSLEPTPVSTSVSEEVPVAPEPVLEPDLGLGDDEDEEEAATPLESPFLTDAKVEKRPLGAFSGADADLPLIEDPLPMFAAAAQPTETPDTLTLASDSEDIPRELHEDVLLLEAHSEEEPESVPQPTSTPETVATPDASDTPTGPTSITQQYKEQPNTASQPSGSIFDTEAYHQALTHPAKKHSSALTIIWIIALILVGGGMGVGIYFVVLPMIK